MSHDDHEGDSGDGQSPKAAFREGLGLLFQAARGAVGGLRSEIRESEMSKGFREAAAEMKRAAQAAIEGEPRELDSHYVQPEAADSTSVSFGESPADDDDDGEERTDEG